MAMRAIETERMHTVGRSAIIRQIDIFAKVSDMDAFMDTFDQAVTVGEQVEWDVWAKRNGVDARVLDDEDYLLISHIVLSPYLNDSFNKAERLEATYLASCLTHGSEQDYLDFLFFLSK